MNNSPKSISRALEDSTLAGQAEEQLELTVLMPCLNEAETLEICINKAHLFLESSGVVGEVLIADNGSTDGSQELAKNAGARVVNISTRGYGAALIGGIKNARGKFIIMGDADDSYDFEQLESFVAKLREDADIVMGNRFKGGIAPGAMPFLHQYLGNPVLSFCGQLLYDVPTGDFHCGLRGFNRERISALDLRTTGMEFASEMVVRAALAEYRIEEVPTTLSPDGRSRPPHLRTWRDGWRHLSFLLLYSPRFLFLYPGIALLAIGLIVSLFLVPGSQRIGSVEFDIHTLIVASSFTVIGTQAISFSVLARRLTEAHQMLPVSRISNILSFFTLERILIGALLLFLFGLSGAFWSVGQWAKVGFGELEYARALRMLILSATSCTIAVQLAFTGFFAAVMEVPSK